MTSGNRTVICCGNIAYDLISRDRDREGNLIFSACPGGSVLNTSIQMARLGIPVSLCSKTGADPLGSALIETIREEGIDTRYIAQDRGLKTGLAFATIDPGGDSSYTFYKPKGPRTSLGRRATPSRDFIRKAAALHTASHFAYNDHTFDDTVRLLSLARKYGVFTSFDPNWRPGRVRKISVARKRINRVIELVDMLKLSAEDALGITGARTLNTAIKKLPPDSIVTLGGDGVLFLTKAGKVHCPSFPVRVQDTIGAGDAFTAGLLYGYIASGGIRPAESPIRSLELASAVSALVCRGHGAVSGLKDRVQLDTFLKNTSEK
jgi:sugar/nucleoside kinase (ribokinase family)